MNLQEFQNYRENKIHTEDNFPYNTYLCSIPLDFPCVPMHWHDEIELIVIKKGRGPQNKCDRGRPNHIRTTPNSSKADFLGNSACYSVKYKFNF